MRAAAVEAASRKRQVSPRPNIRTEVITDVAACRAETLVPDGDRLHLDAAFRDELIRAAGELRANQLPVEALRSGHRDLSACDAMMARIRRELFEGIGFAILDRLPLDNLDEEIAVKLYRLLFSRVCRPTINGLHTAPFASRQNGASISGFHDGF